MSRTYGDRDGTSTLFVGMAMVFLAPPVAGGPFLGGVLASDDRRRRHRPSSPPARSAAVLADAMRCRDAFLDGREEVGWGDAQSGEQRGVEVGGTSSTAGKMPRWDGTDCL